MNNPREINLKEFEEIIESFEGIKGPLIPILHKAQNLYGYIPLEIQNLISKKLKISNAEINGVASFYANFQIIYNTIVWVRSPLIRWGFFKIRKHTDFFHNRI